MTLAKEIKIKKIKEQKDYIEKRLKNPIYRDGDASFPYVGALYPEVTLHFELEGFEVIKVKSDLLTAMAKGRPVYLFTNSKVELTEEELKLAWNYEPDAKEEDGGDNGEGDGKEDGDKVIPEEKKVDQIDPILRILFS